MTTNKRLAVKERETLARLIAINAIKFFSDRKQEYIQSEDFKSALKAKTALLEPEIRKAHAIVAELEVEYEDLGKRLAAEKKKYVELAGMTYLYYKTPSLEEGLESITREISNQLLKDNKMDIHFDDNIKKDIITKADAAILLSEDQDPVRLNESVLKQIIEEYSN